MDNGEAFVWSGGSWIILGVFHRTYNFGMHLCSCVYSAGLFGYVLVFLTSYTIVHIGATLTTCLSIAGQVVASVVIDHFDLFHIKRVPFNSKRIIPLLLIIIGVIIANMG